MTDIIHKFGYNIHYPCMNSIFDIPEHDITVCRIETRKLFRKSVRDHNLSLKYVTELYNSLHPWKHYPLIHSVMIFEELPKKIAERKEKRYQQRLEVGRMALKCGIPSDLVPLICAYTVPYSKIYKYM